MGEISIFIFTPFMLKRNYRVDFCVSVVSGGTGKEMEFEEVNHVFDPFGYGNLMGVKYSPGQWGERFSSVKATVSPGSVSVVT